MMRVTMEPIINYNQHRRTRPHTIRAIRASSNCFRNVRREHHTTMTAVMTKSAAAKGSGEPHPLRIAPNRSSGRLFLPSPGTSPVSRVPRSVASVSFPETTLTVMVLLRLLM